MRIILCTLKSWNISYAQKLINYHNSEHQFRLISEKNEFSNEEISNFQPDFIFFPHWSYIIPEEIYSKYNCVVFHMTDLPYGRGGSPLQNLIVNGLEETKISAIKVVKELDAGPIYMKYPLSLYGSAEEIYMRASKIIFQKMIPEIITKSIVPVEQEGEIVAFKRRKPEDGELLPTMSLDTAYDYIRMLDAEGYPNSFIQYGNLKLSFSRATKKNGKIVADVEIEEINNE